MASAIPKEKKDSFTYYDYLHWEDCHRYEIIDGILFDMSPAPGRTHQKISMELSRHLANFFDKKECEVYAAPFDVLLPEYEEADEDVRNVVQPDITIICDLSKLSEKGCRGAPDVVIEILSPHTAKKDMKYKLILYQRSGVKEYWVVDPSNKLLYQYRLGDNNQYGMASIFTEDEVFEPTLFPELTLDLKNIFQL